MKLLEKEKKHLFICFFYSFSFLFILWLVKIIEFLFQLEFYKGGIYPLRFESLPGIIFSPFLHGDFHHLISNSSTLFILMFSTIYFYKKVALKVFLFSILFTGLWVWLFGRPSYHIGASGLLYALFGFILFSGIFRQNRSLAIVSLATVFYYGSLFWGVFPLKEKISWESHLMGLVAGIILAVFYRKTGPGKTFIATKYKEEEEYLFGDDFVFFSSTSEIKEIGYEIIQDTNNHL